MAKKTYYNLGNMKTKKDKDADGNLQYYIEIDQKLQGRLSIDGKKITTKFIDVERPTTKFDRMLSKGVIDQNEYDKKTEEYSKEGRLSFIKFDLQIANEE